MNSVIMPVGFFSATTFVPWTSFLGRPLQQPKVFLILEEERDLQIPRLFFHGWQGPATILFLAHFRYVQFGRVDSGFQIKVTENICTK